MTVCSNCGDLLTCPTCSKTEIEQLLETNKHLQAALESQRRRTTFISVGTVISVTISLSFALELISLKSLMDYLKSEKPLISRVAPSDEIGDQVEGQIRPKNHLKAQEFVIEDSVREVTLRADVECQNCKDRPLTMLIIAEENYRNYKGGLGYEPTAESSDKMVRFVFDGQLQKGRYYLVFYNSSDHYVPTKIRAYLTFK